MASLLPSAALKTPSSKPKVVPSLLRNRKLQKPKSTLGEKTAATSTNDATTSENNIDKSSSSSTAATVRASNKAGGSSIARGKKRKVAGVAIGLSRQQQQQQQLTTTTTTLGDVTNETGTTEARASSELALVVATTATAVAKGIAPVIPEAQPGELRLSAFCSKFRTKRKKGEAAAAEAAAAPPPPPNNNNNDHSDTGAAVSAGPVVQIVNGEIVLQESSLYVPTARKSVQEVEEEFQQVVEEETHLAAIGASYNSFVVHHPNSSAASVTGSNTRAPQHWNVEDTKLFYEALRQVGTDFGTMTSYFPTRNRKQLKRKYQIESSKHPHLIEWALNPKVQKEIDLSVFQVDPASIVVRPPSPIVTPPAANDSATGQSGVGDQTLATESSEANTAIVDETTALVPPQTEPAPAAPKKPSWLDELDEDDALFPPDMDVEDEFREEALPDMSGAAGAVDEFEDSQPNTASKAVAAPTAATLLGASAASKATAKAKKPKFKAVRSKPKAK